VQALLAERGEISIAELANRFAVSEMTIRRDLEALEEEGIARRVRGGAIATVSRGYEPPFATRAATSAAAKRAIAAVAAAYVEDGETAILDVGTTTLELAKALRGRRGITVVTPSLPVAVELANEPNIRVVVTGGIVRGGENSLVGALAERPFAELNCDVLFLGVGGLDAERGFTEYNLEDARIKRSAIDAARRTVVLADRSKFGRVCLATVAPIEAADVLVTDAAPEGPIAARAREADVDFVTVDLTEEL
jgi:DeoR family fructose operon transcriptional repressor